MGDWPHLGVWNEGRWRRSENCREQGKMVRQKSGDAGVQGRDPMAVRPATSALQVEADAGFEAEHKGLFGADALGLVEAEVVFDVGIQVDAH